MPKALQAGVLWPGRMADVVNLARSSDAVAFSGPCELSLLLFQALQLCPVDEHLKAPDAGAHKAGLGGPGHRADRQHGAHIDQRGGHKGCCGHLLHQLQSREGAGQSGNPTPNAQVGCSGQATRLCRGAAAESMPALPLATPAAGDRQAAGHCRAAPASMHSHFLCAGFSGER